MADAVDLHYLRYSLPVFFKGTGNGPPPQVKPAVVIGSHRTRLYVRWEMMIRGAAHSRHHRKQSRIVSRKPVDTERIKAVLVSLGHGKSAGAGRHERGGIELAHTFDLSLFMISMHSQRSASTIISGHTPLENISAYFATEIDIRALETAGAAVIIARPNSTTK